ncbi:hypothetical protein [Spiroplasma culicicola]|uniref:Lipoprotein n=1 Tax=Spiroplasma culicicola AES-1 TaxID=1276246 RepID=W6A6R5_9MOLU|nr:hypothetical protein [Spiroplasma culicicola]AHI52560.1 hypothetical protein SCULI_v1c02190 [Spiroplasma culicicola AES-1]
MKKLLNALAVMSIVTPSISATVACGNGNGSGDNPDPSDMTQLQKDMIDGADFMTRLILAGRHENLNYNVNEILSIFLTPLSTALYLPINYNNSEGKPVNLSTDVLKYGQLLAPQLRNFDNNGYAGIFASYIMGMYDNNFYQSFLKSGNKDGGYYFNDTINPNNQESYLYKTDQNSLGEYAGASNDLKLSSDESRRQLAWGIQDTGALTNTLLNEGYTGSGPGATHGYTGLFNTAAARNKYGTNSNGYLYYNSIMNSGKSGKIASETNAFDKSNIKKLLEENESTYSYQAGSSSNYGSILKNGTNEYEFNNTGAFITRKASELNVSGHINGFSALLDNINDQESGVGVMLEFMDSMLPIMSNESSDQGSAFSLVIDMWGIVKKSVEDSTNKNILINELKLDSNILDNITLDEKPIIKEGILGGNASTKDASMKVMLNSGDLKEKNAENIVEFFTELNRASQNWNEEQEQKFFEMYAYDEQNKAGLLIKTGIFSTMINNIGKDAFLETVNNSGKGVVNFMSWFGSMYKMVLDNKEVILELTTKYNEGEGKTTYKKLSAVQRNEIKSKLGFKAGKLEEGKFLESFYKMTKDKKTQGQKELEKFFGGFAGAISNNMKELDSNVLQYLYDDKYWQISNTHVSSNDNTQSGAKMSFSLNYTGKGDITSNATEYTSKVNVDSDFNPYQQDNEKTDFSRETKARILGLEQGKIKEDDLIAYDGLGNYENYDIVNHTYNIEWTNVSNDPLNPYWVITKIESFNKEGEQFYNIF